MIEDREFTMDEMRAIAAVSPGCRVNTIRDAKVHKKVRLSLPARIEGLPGMRCPNHGCITRVEHLEAVPPLMMRTEQGLIRCHYCDQMMSSVPFD